MEPTKINSTSSESFEERLLRLKAESLEGKKPGQSFVEEEERNTIEGLLEVKQNKDSFKEGPCLV